MFGRSLYSSQTFSVRSWTGLVSFPVGSWRCRASSKEGRFFWENALLDIFPLPSSFFLPTFVLTRSKSVNTTLEEGDIAGHLAALGNLDPNFQVTVLNPQTIEIKNLPDTEKKKSFASGLQNLIEDFFEFLGGDN